MVAKVSIHTYIYKCSATSVETVGQFVHVVVWELPRGKMNESDFEVFY